MDAILTSVVLGVSLLWLFYAVGGKLHEAGVWFDTAAREAPSAGWPRFYEFGRSLCVAVFVLWAFGFMATCAITFLVLFLG